MAIKYTRLWESILSKHLVNADKRRALRKIAEGEEENVAGWSCMFYIQMEEKVFRHGGYIGNGTMLLCPRGVGMS